MCKMKCLAFLLLTTLLSISCAVQKYKMAPVAIKCPLLLPVSNYSEIILLDMDVHTHQDFKTCIMKNNIHKQSFLLLNTDVQIKENITRSLLRTNNNPNIIILTKYLTSKMFNSTLWRFFVKSNWSLLYIIVTGENKFRCKNGTMTSIDFLLLDNIMNTLWHRFQIMRVGVVFPFACKYKMVIYNGKRPSTKNLYDRFIKLINATNYDEIHTAIKKSGEKLTNEYPIKASIFYRYPTAIKDCENLHYYVNFDLNLTDGYCGLDGMVMHDITSHLKFNITFNREEKCNYYGYGVAGNVSGTLGCVMRKELDISFNSRFMTLYSDEHIYYMTYVKTDKLCACIRKPDIKPLWQGVYNLFSASLWALIAAVLMAIGGIMWATAMINKTMVGAEIMTFWSYLHNSVITTILGYSPVRTRTLLMIKSACLVGSIFFLAIYQGHVSRVFTTVERFQQLKTLKELYYSGVTLYTSPSMRDILKQIQNPDDKLQEEFLDRTIVIAGDRDRLGVVLQHKLAATVDRKTDAEMEILEQYADNNGTPLLDIVDECFYTYYLSCITRSGFPFFEELQVFTERLNEAGLPNIYYKWTQQMLEIPNYKLETNSEPRTFTQIRLQDQCVAFGILFVGTIVSAVVFAAEMWIARRKYYKLYKSRP